MVDRPVDEHPGARLGAHPGAAWCALALVLAVPALALGWTPLDPAQADPLHAHLMWVREAALSQPWRCWTAAWVHGSAPHLMGNLMGAVLVALLGVVARVPARFALAWAVAWPLTHLSLLIDPRLLAYGGLSGVLHAGVAVAAISLLSQPALRRLGWALLMGLLLKVGFEAPWRDALVASTTLGVAVAPLVHLTGVVCGILGGSVLGGLIRRLAPAG